METDFRDYLETCFNVELKNHGINIQKKIDENNSFFIEYYSKNFIIILEKYRHEIYLSLYKFGSTKEINLFNLLNYLIKDTGVSFKGEYFKNESDIQECLKKQLEYIKTVFLDNFSLITNFFKLENYETEILELEKFIINKHPELFVIQKK